ncbi:uncharacterized protein LOC122051925 [Zingiber officinale]|uniref:Uncharacterized protein n=1 Tax=Zingiber officinale TaxID=94328 RepID=A0A8J5LIN8_ZINOF|nr:uncharacterized protein LOC122051925 [Zingiber officinale]KAG6521131.1 hypothetical protein ZIOFF_018197 [Zingiber officinale]
MVELSLLASTGLPSAVLYQDHQGLYKTPPKEFHSGLSFNGRKQDAAKSGSVQFDVHQSEELLHPMPMLLGSNQSLRISPMIRQTVLMDVQDSHTNSVLFSLGIAEKCIRNEKIMELLRSRSKFTEGKDLDVSLLSEVMGLHDVAIDMLSPRHVLMDDKFSLYNAEMNDQDHPLHILKQIYAPEFQLDFGRNLSDTLYYREDQDGQLLFPDNPAKIEDLLSIVSKFNLPKRSPIGSKKSLLVPYFTRRGRRRSQAQKQVTPPTVAPVKSSEVPKQKPMSKKKKRSTERDLYQRNSFHAFESLLSVLLNGSCSTSLVSLKKSGPEISQVLTKISAAIAGAGLAIIFSVAYKVACGRVALCATRVLSTGCGLSLFWLSRAINGLRDTLVYLSKSSGKSNLKEEEVASMVKRSMNEILFRTMALVAVTALKFA